MRNTIASIVRLTSACLVWAGNNTNGDQLKTDAAAQEAGCKIEITVTDKKTGKPVPCRIALENSTGDPERSGSQLVWRDQLVCVSDGIARLSLPAGRYTYEVERGPEYRTTRGMLLVPAQATEKKLAVEIERIADLRAEGWWSGDLHVHRPLEDIERLMLAEDLQVASVITWWNSKNLWAERKLPADPLVRFDGNRYYHIMGGEDENLRGLRRFFTIVVRI